MQKDIARKKMQMDIARRRRITIWKTTRERPEVSPNLIGVPATT